MAPACVRDRLAGVDQPSKEDISVGLDVSGPPANTQVLGNLAQGGPIDPIRRIEAVRVARYRFPQRSVPSSRPTRDHKAILGEDLVQQLVEFTRICGEFLGSIQHPRWIQIVAMEMNHKGALSMQRA